MWVSSETQGRQYRSLEKVKTATSHTSIPRLVLTMKGGTSVRVVDASLDISLCLLTLALRDRAVLSKVGSTSVKCSISDTVTIVTGVVYYSSIFNSGTHLGERESVSSGT